MRFGTLFSLAACTLAVLTLCSFAVVAQDRSGAALQNPVKADASSIAAGQKTFNGQCASCHGMSGKGDGRAAPTLNPKPADLTDAEWTHGSSDGEIFAVIRDGAKGTGMKGFGGKLSANDIWNVVNYLRTLAPQ